MLEHVGKPRDFAAEGFEPLDHIELGAGSARSTSNAVPRWRGPLLLPDRGRRPARARPGRCGDGPGGPAGFIPVIPPALVKPRAMEGTGFLGQAADDVYHLPKDDLYLVGTSEVALAAYHSDEILDPGSLPLRYAGFSPCYRREAGSYGKDTRGIFRVHWFDKVEMFTYTSVEDSYAEHERLLAWEKQWITISGWRTGSSTWQPAISGSAPSASSTARRGSRRRVSTASSRRRRTARSSRRGASTSGCAATTATEPAATLNGTLMASARTIVAILEKHQQADGSVRVPEVLRPYLQGRDTLEPVL